MVMLVVKILVDLVFGKIYGKWNFIISKMGMGFRMEFFLISWE